MIKFDFVIGNPPYQEDLEGTSRYAPSIFNDFMDASYKIADKVEMITPAKFLFNAGSTPKAWNKKMLNDQHFKVLMYEPDASKVFPSQSFSGGVAIHYRDENKSYGAIKFFAVNDLVGSIVQKTKSLEGFESIQGEIYIQNNFNLKALYSDFPGSKSLVGSSGKDSRIRPYYLSTMGFIFSEKGDLTTGIKVCGLVDRKREYRYIDRKYINNIDNSNIDSYKVMLSAADGASGTIGTPIPARLIGTPTVEEKGVGCSKTFFSIGSFDERIDAENLKKYLCCKFTRILVGSLKSTNSLKENVWANVPIQNFTSSSDIDWSKPIPEIDLQLYRKYNLSDEEIAFIESHVKEME